MTHIDKKPQAVLRGTSPKLRGQIVLRVYKWLSVSELIFASWIKRMKNAIRRIKGPNSRNKITPDLFVKSLVFAFRCNRATAWKYYFFCLLPHWKSFTDSFLLIARTGHIVPKLQNSYRYSWSDGPKRLFFFAKIVCTQERLGGNPVVPSEFVAMNAHALFSKNKSRKRRNIKIVPLKYMPT